MTTEISTSPKSYNNIQEVNYFCRNDQYNILTFSLLAKTPHDEHQQFLTTGSNVNKLFYGDNLEILQRHIPSESIDLIYLDPPFNSKADYNILFREPSGEQSTAQIQAFSDFWHWDNAARESYEYLTSNSVDNKIANLAESFYSLLGKNDMTAYLFMMASRLIELQRVLKPTGSLFLHCDPNASHYLKLLLDGIFKPQNFRNEIIWRRSHPKGHAFTRFASNHDVLLVYAKDVKHVKFKMTYKDYDPVKVAKIYNHKDSDGRFYTLDNLLNPNINRPNLTYEFKGIKRVWRWTKERMMEEDAKGRIIVPKGGKGVPSTNVILMNKRAFLWMIYGMILIM